MSTDRLTATFVVAVLCCYCLNLCSATDPIVSPKLFVSRPPGSKYTVVLTADAGTLKGAISVPILVALENTIKEHILTEVSELLPNDRLISTIDDFEVSLADFVDCFGASSAGSWTMSYLASKGGNGHARAVLSEKRIIDVYGVIEPGSAKGLFVFYNEFGNVILPRNLVPDTGLPTGADPTEPGLVAPVLTPSGIEFVLDEFLGNVKMSELSATCLISAYDLNAKHTIMFFYDDLAPGTPTYGYVNLLHRNESKAETSLAVSDADVVIGQDFLVKDVSLASSAAPIFFPSRNTTSVGDKTETLLLSDGALGIVNPTLYAIAHVQNSTQETSVENMAVISIGTGHGFANYSDNAEGGVVQWLGSGDFINAAYMASADILNNLLDLLFYGNPNVKAGQYLRVQAFGDPGTERARILAGGFFSDEIDDLILIGEELAKSYALSFQAFVRNFVFPN
eukprot:g4890.t1